MFFKCGGRLLEYYTQSCDDVIAPSVCYQVPLFFEAEQKAIIGARGARATIEDLLTSGKASLQVRIRVVESGIAIGGGFGI